MKYFREILIDKEQEEIITEEVDREKVIIKEPALKREKEILNKSRALRTCSRNIELVN